MHTTIDLCFENEISSIAANPEKSQQAFFNWRVFELRFILLLIK